MISAVALVSASAAVAATLALAHRTLGGQSVSHGTLTTPSRATTSTNTLELTHPYEPIVDGWTVAPDLDPPPPGMVTGRGVRFSLLDHYQGRPAGNGQKWLVVPVTITNQQATARPFNARVELNAYELKLYTLDPTGLAQFRSAVNAHASVRRVLLFRVPRSVNSMYLTFRPDLGTALARGQEAELNLNCC